MFRTALESLVAFEVVGDMRGSHMMWGIELVEDKATRVSFDTGVGAGHRVFTASRDRGLIVRPIGDKIVLSPPPIFSENDCRQTAQILSEAIEAVTPRLQEPSARNRPRCSDARLGNRNT